MDPYAAIVRASIDFYDAIQGESVETVVSALHEAMTTKQRPTLTLVGRVLFEAGDERIAQRPKGVRGRSKVS